MFKKWQDGAKKHGGLLQAAKKQTDQMGREADKALKKASSQTDQIGRDVDKALGKPSSLVSSNEEKRKGKQNEYKDAANSASGGVLGKSLNHDDQTKLAAEVDLGEDLETPVDAERTSETHFADELKSYLRTDNEISSGEVDKIYKIITGSNSNAELAASLIRLGHKQLNNKIKDWVKNHVPEDATLDSLKKVAAEYYANHTDEQDVAATLAEIEISEFVEKLFALDRPELNSDITEVLLSAEEKDISGDLSTAGDFSQ